MLLPIQLDVWLVLIYASAILVAARGVEAIAQFHFRRAAGRDHANFNYLESEDRFICPAGRHLTLHVVDHVRRRAEYRAQASDCNACSLKNLCAPTAESRRVFRPLTSWTETDVGRFHRRLSAVMFCASAAVSSIGLWRWRTAPGAGFLGVVLAAALWSLTRELRRIEEDERPA